MSTTLAGRHNTCPYGFHLLPGSDPAAVARAARGAPVIKVCDATAVAVARAAGCPWIYYRPYLPDDGDCADGAAWAQVVWQALLHAGGATARPQAGPADLGALAPEAICYRNECSASSATARSYLAFRATLRTLGYRGQTVLGSFSVGTPDWPEWTALLAGLDGARPDAIDLHEYWSLSVDGSAPWWALRHVEAIRRGLLPADWPIYIGECGSDDVGPEDPQHRRGWNDNGKLTAEQELGNLLAYQQRCAASVQVCFVFADGNSDANWLTYHTFDTPVEAGIRATWQGSSGAPAPATPPGPAGPPAPTGNRRGRRPVTPVDAVAEERERQVTAVEAADGQRLVGVVDAVPELQQGPTRLCWAECVQEAFAGAGYSVSVYDLYKQVKGVDYVPPGAAATFAELTACVRVAATLSGASVRWFGANGRVNDLATFDQLLRDGSWVVIVGANEQALVDDLGLTESAGYGHYFLCRHITFDGAGTPETDTIDSFRAYDHVPVRVPLAAVHDAMVRNWDADYDALAFQVG